MTTEPDINTIVDRIEHWLEELESGKHKQGRQHLLQNGTYCCLGVAADIVLGYRAKIGSSGVVFFSNPNGTEGMGASIEEPEDMGLLTPLGGNTKGTKESSLYYLNDHEGMTFPEIAAILRDDLANNNRGYFIDAVYPAWKERNAA